MPDGDELPLAARDDFLRDFGLLRLRKGVEILNHTKPWHQCLSAMGTKTVSVTGKPKRLLDHSSPIGHSRPGASLARSPSGFLAGHVLKQVAEGEAVLVAVVTPCRPYAATICRHIVVG